MGKNPNLIGWCIVEIFTLDGFIATVTGFCFFLFSKQVEPVDFFFAETFTVLFHLLIFCPLIIDKKTKLWPYLLGVLSQFFFSMLDYFSSLLNFIFVSGLVSDWRGMCQVRSRWTSFPHQASTFSRWRTNRLLFLPIMQVS